MNDTDTEPDDFADELAAELDLILADDPGTDPARARKTAARRVAARKNLAARGEAEAL